MWENSAIQIFDTIANNDMRVEARLLKDMIEHVDIIIIPPESAQKLMIEFIETINGD